MEASCEHSVPPTLLSLLCFCCTRLSKAIENLQHFTLAADPSFRHFQLDVSKELKLLTELNFIQGEEGSDEGGGGGEDGESGRQGLTDVFFLSHVYCLMKHKDKKYS